MRDDSDRTGEGWKERPGCVIAGGVELSRRGEDRTERKELARCVIAGSGIRGAR